MYIMLYYVIRKMSKVHILLNIFRIYAKQVPSSKYVIQILSHAYNICVKYLRDPIVCTIGYM